MKMYNFNIIFRGIKNEIVGTKIACLKAVFKELKNQYKINILNSLGLISCF